MGPGPRRSGTATYDAQMPVSLPSISVLTPVWNEETHIQTMMDSLRRQPYANWELVLVDDGSTDRTVEIIEAAAEVDDRIRLVHRDGKLGKVAAFNLAFAHSRGEIICHVGGDDYVTPAALTARVGALRGLVDQRAAAYFHFRMVTDESDRGTVLPRGANGSRSGPSTTLTRPLAEQIFPVPEHLPSEDLWIGEASFGLADHVVHSPEIVVNYRVHQGNSNPRHKSFVDMSDSISRRSAFIPELLGCGRFELSPEVRRDLERRWIAEQRRAQGETLGVLRSDLGLADRLGIASMSDARLWRLRKLAYRGLSGWRGR